MAIGKKQARERMPLRALKQAPTRWPTRHPSYVPGEWGCRPDLARVLLVAHRRSPGRAVRCPPPAKSRDDDAMQNFVTQLANDRR